MVSCTSPWGLSSSRLKQSAYRGPSPLGRAAPSAFALRFDAPGQSLGLCSISYFTAATLSHGHYLLLLQERK